MHKIDPGTESELIFSHFEKHTMVCLIFEKPLVSVHFSGVEQRMMLLINTNSLSQLLRYKFCKVLMTMQKMLTNTESKTNAVNRQMVSIHMCMVEAVTRQ